MKRPRPLKTKVDSKRIKAWLREFSGYRHSVGELSVSNWLKQFTSTDRDLAARVLDVVEFYGLDRIATAFRKCLSTIPGWDAKPSKRQGRWRFVAYTGSSGTSADSMIYHFRVANGLDAKTCNEMFIHPSEIIRQKLGPDDTIVLVDDLVATGDQACEAWRDTFAELTANVGRVYLVVVAAVKEARKRIKDETDLRVVAAHNLDATDNLFSDECSSFTGSEKDRLLTYNKRADTKLPRGYGGCGLVVVFQHRCPNNSVPILHADNNRWCGLFQRHD